jgi:hypothetical protein
VDNRLTIFTPRILLVHDQDGQLRLSREELSAYDEAKGRIGDRANEAFGYRAKMIESGEAPSSAARAPAISMLTSSGACTGAIRCGGLSRRTSSPTPTRTFESSSTRRKAAIRTAPSAAPEPPPRRTSGARSEALLTRSVRRRHYEGFLNLLARPAHQFTRLNNSSGLSALLRNFSYPRSPNPARAISESVLSDFNGLRHHFRIVPFPVLGGRSPAHAICPEKGDPGLSIFLKNNIRSKPDLSRNCRFSGRAPASRPGSFTRARRRSMC